MINFKTKLIKIGEKVIVRLPREASSKLPSRGIVAVMGSVNKQKITTVLEPDGVGSHWFEVSGKSGDMVTVTLETTDVWPEPKVSGDIKKALEESDRAHEVWKDITPMARWDWVRWINSTKNMETRKKRIEVAMSKMRSGKRRPCCFNRTECTVPEVANGGVLMGTV